jgi:hypothetical protein
MYNDAERAGHPAPAASPVQGSDAVVALANDLAGVQAPDGVLVPADRLGVGLVRAVGLRGDVQVHWVAANIDTWVAADDVRPLGAGWRLVTMWRRDRHEPHPQSFPALLDHHWTVELLPGHIIRAVRADGPCWTFTFNSLTHEVNPPWETQLDDDAAEAIVAADLAMARLYAGGGLIAALIRRAAEIAPFRRLPWPRARWQSRN